jgi:hypothetical protein
MDNMMNLMTKLGNNSRESKLSEEMDTGMFDEKGPVVVQMRRQLKSRNVEAPVPPYLPPVEPWFRYKEFDLVVKRNYKGRDLFDNIHPLAERELAVFHRQAKYVDKGAMIKKNVTRPTAAMLTWPKRFECSAFWCDGAMKLLEIDGKTPPGEKPQGNTEAAATKEEAPPKLNPEELKSMAKRKSTRLRDTIVEAAMSGPAPSGLDRKDRSGLDSLIFHAQDKVKALASKKLAVAEEEPPSPTPAKKWGRGGAGIVKRDSMLSTRDLSAIEQLSEKLDHAHIGAPQVAGAGFSGAEDPMYQLRLLTVKYEKEALKAKLAFAEMEAQKVKAEQEAMRAKMTYAEKEVEMLNNLLDAYADAEERLKSMVN